MESIFAMQWENEIFERSKRSKFGKLVVKENSKIRVLPGVVVEVECEQLALLGPVQIDGHGNNGRDGQTPSGEPEQWVSGPPEDRKRATGNYLAALKDMKGGNPYWHGADARPGTDGEHGGTLIIHYHSLAEESVGDVTGNDMSAGRGGAYAKGGPGRLCVNGANRGEQVRGPDGKEWGPGQDGRAGKFILKRI